MAAASIWSVDNGDVPVKQEELALTGNLISEARQLHDPAGGLGCYFIFQDLAVRREGRFRLMFTIVNTMKYDRVNLGAMELELC